jgi:UDP:flavonoid glycosyltransferase YjiC (YdhE family)
MRIAVVAVGTRGDVEPHAALCQGLRQAGYEARLCAPDDFGPSFLERGIPFDPIPVSFRGLYESSCGHALLATGGNGFRFLSGLSRVAVDVAAQVIAGIRAACREADAVCYSPLGFPALYFAHEMGIPAFATSLQPLGRTGEHSNPLLSLPAWTPSFVNRFSYRLVEQVFWQVARPLLRPHVRDPLPVWGHFHELYEGPGPALFAYSPLVSPQPRDWKPWMHATGYWRAGPADWQPPEGLEEFLAAAPAVCIGFGSMHSPRIARILDTALEALARSGRRAVILTGWSGYAGRCAGQDGSVFVIGDAPHEWLFPRVSAVVHHGGAGTTAAALRAGVPSVILPFFFDQGFWGQRLAACGLGPPPIAFYRLSTATLERALDAAERSHDMRCRLQRLSAKLRREDGVGRAVAILDQALEKVR